MDETSDPGEIAELVALLGHRHHAWLSRQAKSHDLTVPQTRTLIHLYLAGAVTMRAISDLNSLSPAGTTDLVEQLVQRGMLERLYSDRNRRQIEVQLSEAGVAMADAIYDDLHRVATETLDSLATQPNSSPTILLRGLVAAIENAERS